MFPMNWMNALRRTIGTRCQTQQHRKCRIRRASDLAPQNFGEVIAYLAWYVRRTPEYVVRQWPDGSPCCHLPLCHRYLMAWLRNELDETNTLSTVRGEEWSL
ncbi:MAG: hypothetical protein CHACPFDD_00865 [Phycisphaerae bacterium]|nr:hypothetical protein [Phycisphaerae bacterium]